MLFKFKSNPMHPMSGALPLPYVPAHVTHGALVAQRHSFMPPRFRTSQYSRTFVPLSESLCLMVWDRWFQEQSQCFPICMNCSFIFVSYYFILL